MAQQLLAEMDSCGDTDKKLTEKRIDKRKCDIDSSLPGWSSRDSGGFHLVCHWAIYLETSQLHLIWMAFQCFVKLNSSLPLRFLYTIIHVLYYTTTEHNWQQPQGPHSTEDVQQLAPFSPLWQLGRMPNKWGPKISQFWKTSRCQMWQSVLSRFGEGDSL